MIPFIESVKKQYPGAIVLVKFDTFLCAYEKDADALHLVFNSPIHNHPLGRRACIELAQKPLLVLRNLHISYAVYDNGCVILTHMVVPRVIQQKSVVQSKSQVQKLKPNVVSNSHKNGCSNKMTAPKPKYQNPPKTKVSSFNGPYVRSGNGWVDDTWVPRPLSGRMSKVQQEKLQSGPPMTITVDSSGIITKIEYD